MKGTRVMAAAQTVAILGASADTGRYAFKAQRLLKEQGHRVVPVNPRGGVIDGETVCDSLAAIDTAVDTLTVYLRPSQSATYATQILALRPGRVIFNPGTENPALAAQLEAAGIPCEDACTLVLLRTGQF
jgi:hypothetical protein